MKLTKENYIVSKETLSAVLSALEANWFSSDGEDEYNNESVISAQTALEAELSKQENT